MSQAIFSDVFGRLEWDDRLGGWLGDIDWPPPLHVEVVLWHPGTDVVAGLRLAAESFAWLQEHEEEARRRIARELLENEAEPWQDEDELARQLIPLQLGFVEDGSLLLTYDAGELFDGHLVEGEFGPDRSFRGAGLIE
jgi:hypothetical protein